MISTAQDATRAAIADGVRLLEVEFPTGGLESVSGDSEGANEMTYSLEFLRRFCVLFQLSDSVSTTRVFFPDKAVRWGWVPLQPSGGRGRAANDRRWANAAM